MYLDIHIDGLLPEVHQRQVYVIVCEDEVILAGGAPVHPRHVELLLAGHHHPQVLATLSCTHHIYYYTQLSISSLHHVTVLIDCRPQAADLQIFRPVLAEVEATRNRFCKRTSASTSKRLHLCLLVVPHQNVKIGFEDIHLHCDGVNHSTPRLTVQYLAIQVFGVCGGGGLCSGRLFCG